MTVRRFVDTNILLYAHDRDEPAKQTAALRLWQTWLHLYGLPVVENTLELFDAALAAQERWRLSLWDAMILAAAQASGASELITEDFNSGQDYGGVVARNPFARA